MVDSKKTKINFMKYIDTHAHVNFNAYKEDADEVIKRSLEKGVGVVNVGSQYSTSVRAVEMAHRFENVWAVIGIHPLHLRKQNLSYQDSSELEATEIKTSGEEFDYKKYLELAKDEKVVAIGEVGLDYHHFEEGDDVEKLKQQQQEVLLKAIQLANEINKPIMLHCWDAYPDLLEILKKYPVEKKGIVHSFVGGYKTAKKFIELGYKIGLNGVITYTDDFSRLIKEISLEDIVLETDCPYLTPVPHKGERNEPYMVELVAKKISEVLEIDIEDVKKITSGNAIRVFGIKKESLL
ncbi:MAG: Sec-independent protein tatd [Parcubacteria group bacterium GW2011_GWE2_39_37]|uniref:Sec-independent protein tatd n=1 Tax=Candidatus Falkowbacteria bacterium GW2011_GWF2_39_8 TaxID=1618642 RepID=A0A0G0PXV5_9BACT|nr:MAG: Sec-independent protein tatd [Parcubacteria group bacterium GW2011_GWE2_39_37]KKR32949.1 MAG: Sec-independent protein tatd [Candidatus Falkowbacteria bacterium GW2011_GWF2_39_8]